MDENRSLFYLLQDIEKSLSLLEKLDSMIEIRNQELITHNGTTNPLRSDKIEIERNQLQSYRNKTKNLLDKLYNKTREF